MKINSVYYLQVRMGSKCSYLVSCLFLSSFLFGAAEACWGKEAPDYVEMTRDYDLLVGSELVLNCTLKARFFPNAFSRPISSSDLVFEQGDLNFTSVTRKMDDYTIQMKIPEAKMSDTGIYYCKIVAPNGTKPVVCSSQVSVGYPPMHVSNFTCMSKNYDNLKCSWNTEKNGISTDYRLVMYLYNVQGYEQTCPKETEKPNSCEWSTKTDPMYKPFSGNVSFSVKGNNSLGTSIDDFTLDGYAIVIPNSPEHLKAVHVETQFITFGWSPPTMNNYAFKLAMQYEVWIGKLSYNSSDIQVFDAGKDTQEITIRALIPYISYNISVRCRSVSAKKENMWSPLASLTVRTLPDVPYITPKIIPEAYEIHLYGNSRSISLYWKDVSQLFHNGEDFHFHIKYFRNTIAGPSNIYSVNSSEPFVEIKKLLKNSSYSFHIYSANSRGISENYELFFVDSQDKIPYGPKDIRAISQDVGHYNLSWNRPYGTQNVSYTVFWCSRLRSWVPHCDSPVQWIHENVTGNSIILNLSDAKTNFRFAVVAKSETSSSGMKWASCIVPHKAALGKILSVMADQKNATSLKVIWKLDCHAQKAVVDRYEIIYCKINSNAECKVDTVVDPDAETYFLQDLQPFTNYSIKIRAFNKDNLPSEDSDVILQTTSSGAPSGSPQNVVVYSTSSSSFHVSWTAPAEPNGIITKYIIIYNGLSEEHDVSSSEKEYNRDVNGLNPFTDYAVQIKACVNDHCSIKSEPVMIRTDVGEPGYMDPPRIETENSTHFKVSWTTPVHPNGPIDYYIVKWLHEGQNETSSFSGTVQVRGALSVVVGVKCPGNIGGGEKFSFYVRAVNMKNRTGLLGPSSESTQATACLIGQGVATTVGIVFGAVCGTSVIIFLLYWAITWMRKTIHQVKSITIKLPNGLEGPETNPLNHYEYFKHGLNQSIQENSIERLSYIIDENEKNRHGSGSSQFSNSSADELIFKNGKCTKFGRKPSGDSSGCSSMSSNTTPRIHLSYDSGTESDFVVPPSPDSAITEPSLHSSHKSPLPILMEVQTGEQISSSPVKQAYGKNAVDDMILKGHQPYSKFGIAGSTASSVPSRVNPLVFYSCNLANSEPSFFNLQTLEQPSTAVAPYSKVGLAKSSGDILGMSPMKQNGYSKFGFPTSQKRFSIPPPNLNPIAMVMMESPNIKKYLGKKMDSEQMTDEQPLHSSSQELEEDCGYIKIGVGKLCAKKCSQGYVPFNDLKDQLRHIPPGTAMHHDPKDLYHDSPEERDQEVADDVDWPYNSFEEENKNLMHEETPNVIFDVPFLQSSVNGSPKDCEPFSDFKVPFPGNLDASPHKLHFGDDVKYCFDSPPFSQSTENQHFEPTSLSNSPKTSHVPFSDENSMSEEPESGSVCNGKTDNWYDVQSEVVVTPMTLKNSYVPFSTLSDPMCDRTLHHLPNSPKSNAPLALFTNGVYSDVDNYVTPSNKGELRLLRDDSLSKMGSPNKQKDNKIPNGIGYTNGSLKYILKPLPKMESEICEV